MRLFGTKYGYMLLQSPSENNIIRKNSLATNESDNCNYRQTDSSPSHTCRHTNQADRPKDSKITTTAYHCGKAPYKTVAIQPVQTCTPR